MQQHLSMRGAEGASLDSVPAGKVFDNSIGYPSCNLRKDGHSMLLRIYGISRGRLVGFH